MEKCIGGGRLTSNATWTPIFRKQQLARKGLSQRVQNHNQHRVARIEPVFWQAAIRAKMQCDKRVLACSSGCIEKTQPDGGWRSCRQCCGSVWRRPLNADAKRQCLGKGQTMPTKPPIQYGETRYGSRVTMSERMINTKRIYDMAPV